CYPRSWIDLVDLLEEVGGEDSYKQQKEALRRFLQQQPEGVEAAKAWKRLAIACKRDADVVGECSSWVEMCALPETPIHEVSRAVNRVNALLTDKSAMEGGEKNVALQRLAGILV